jgi:hypothetical protein
MPLTFTGQAMAGETWETFPAAATAEPWNVLRATVVIQNRGTYYEQRSSSEEVNAGRSIE